MVFLLPYKKEGRKGRILIYVHINAKIKDISLTI